MRPRIDDGRVNAPTSSDSRLGTAGSQPRLAGIRVAIVLKWAGFGGAERQALALARHLKEIEGASVEVQALSDADGRAVAEFHEAGIPWRARKRSWRGSRSRTFLRLASTTTELRRARPDVLLPYCDVPNVVCGLVWRYAGARTCVWSQRDTFPFTLDDAFVRRALRTTPVIVSNSHHGAEYLETFGAPRERIRVIPNGVDLEPTDTSPTTWRRRLGTSDEDVVVTSLAHFYERKDHATLLDAWRRVLDGADGSRDRLTLVLAGRPEGRRSLLEARARDLQVDDRVRFVGDVEDVAGLLAASDVGVLSSPNGGLLERSPREDGVRVADRRQRRPGHPGRDRSGRRAAPRPTGRCRGVRLGPRTSVLRPCVANARRESQRSTSAGILRPGADARADG